jgi:putative glutamine amidotransferase
MTTRINTVWMARDAAETALLREALRIEMPVLAVCRGAQVVNVAIGGTLLQHLPDVAGLVDRGRPGAAVRRSMM